MLKTVCVCAPEVVERNHERAVSRGLPWLTARSATDKPLAIVGGGKSAKDYLHEILSFPGDVLAINGAYDWLQDQGRVADLHVLLDPQFGMDMFVQRPNQKTTYLVATCCDPTVFDALKAQNVLVWFSQQGTDTRPGIPGGSTALTRAPVLGAFLGYRDITIYGGDSCFLGAYGHVYEDDPFPPDAIRIICDGREWLTSLQFLAQAEYLAEMLPAMQQGMKVRLRGDHLAAALLKAQAWQEAQ